MYYQSIPTNRPAVDRSTAGSPVRPHTAARMVASGTSCPPNVNPACHSGDSHLGGWKPEKEEMDLVSNRLQPPQLCAAYDRLASVVSNPKLHAGRGQFAQSPARMMRPA